MIAVNLILGLLVWMFPPAGINLGKLAQLKFVSVYELTGDRDSSVASVDIASVLKDVSPKEFEPSGNRENNDSIVNKIDEEIVQSVNYDTLTLKLVTPRNRAIQLPPSNNGVLKNFIEALLYESKTKVVRVLHYGDSQLEGDRITDYLRNRLQMLFGGKGPGIILPSEPAADSRRTVLVGESKNIKKQAFYIKGKHAKEGKYGLGATVFSFTGSNTNFVGVDSITVSDSTNEDSVYFKHRFSKGAQTRSFILVKNRGLGYKTASKYSSIKLLYTSNEPFQVKLNSDNYVEDYFVKANPNFGIKQWDINTNKKLKLEFTQGNFPKIYGLALDGKVGVAVDNFGMRGSSAIGFEDMNKAFYNTQLKALNVRFIILQYGINVVPNIRSDYGYYRNKLIKQLNSIKAAYPGVSILVIGPSDMSRNKGGNMVSYTNVPLIRDAMKGAAFDTGCAFWDLYEAMGGKNSMVSWVNNDLAKKDYTHFSYEGASYVGEMLFEAILEQMQNQGYVN